MKKGLIYLIIFLLSLILILPMGIAANAEDHGYLPDSSARVQTEDEAGEEEAPETEEPEEGKQVPESQLLTWETGIGSAGLLDGNIVVVSIFTDDGETYWDFSREEDRNKKAHALDYLRIATEWISGEGRKWGKDPVFYFDWEADPDLYYEAQIDTDVADYEEDPTEEMADMIEQYVDYEELLKRYHADSIVYMSFINTPWSNEEVSFTLPYDDEVESEFEIVYILTGCDGEEETPAAYAHEILHTFGAPDLYNSDMPAYNYNIDQTYVDYCEQHHANEIMMTTYDVDTQESYFDHISNELTEITAYYIGWTDTCEEVDRFHLQHSQYPSDNRITGKPKVQ